MSTYATLIPTACGKEFTNMTGERAPFAATFATYAAPTRPYMESCAAYAASGFCGRSGQCWRENAPNYVCGPRQPYTFGTCRAVKFPDGHAK